MSYNVIKNVGGQYTNESADGSIYTYMNPNGIVVVADALGTPITTQYIGSKISKDIGNLAVELSGNTVATFTSTGITASTFTGALSGNASTATTATNTAITASSTNSTFYPSFVSATTGNLPQLVDSDLTYNPSTNTLATTNINATTFTGALTGNASSATTTTNAEITDTNTTGTYYPTFVSGTGTQGLKIDSATGPFSYAIDSAGVGTLTVRDRIILTESVSGTAISTLYETDGSGNIQIISNTSNANVNIGTTTKTGQNTSCIAIGHNSGTSNQGIQSIAIGHNAGQTSQGQQSVAIGPLAGYTSQGSFSVAIGYEAGKTSSSQNSIAIGTYAGSASLGQNSIAIGVNAGQTNCGNSTIIITSSGSNISTTNTNNLILSASGLITSSGNSRCYISPIRNAYNSYSLDYDNTNKEVTAYSKLSTQTVTTTDQNFLLSSTTNLVIKTANTDTGITTALLPSTAVDGQRISLKIIYDASSPSSITKPTVRITTVNAAHTIRGTNSLTLTKPYPFSTSSDYVEFVYYNGTFSILTLV